MGEQGKDKYNPTLPIPISELLAGLDLPQKDKEKLEQAFFVQTTFYAEAVARPVPSPEDMAKYHAISPEIVTRLISMAENTQKGEIQIEKAIIENEKRKIHGAIILGTLLIIAAIVAIHLGQISGGVVLGLAGVFSSILTRILNWLDRRKHFDSDI